MHVEAVGEGGALDGGETTVDFASWWASRRRFASCVAKVAPI